MAVIRGVGDRWPLITGVFPANNKYSTVLGIQKITAVFNDIFVLLRSLCTVRPYDIITITEQYYSVYCGNRAFP